MTEGEGKVSMDYGREPPSADLLPLNKTETVHCHYICCRFRARN